MKIESLFLIIFAGLISGCFNEANSIDSTDVSTLSSSIELGKERESSSSLLSSSHKVQSSSVSISSSVIRSSESRVQSSSMSSSSSSAKLAQEICNDGIDNDKDHLTDCNDWKCAPSIECIRKSEQDLFSCHDSIDNDKDGMVDCNDTDCRRFFYCTDFKKNKLFADSVDAYYADPARLSNYIIEEEKYFQYPLALFPDYIQKRAIFKDSLSYLDLVDTKYRWKNADGNYSVSHGAYTGNFSCGGGNSNKYDLFENFYFGRVNGDFMYIPNQKDTVFHFEFRHGKLVNIVKWNDNNFFKPSSRGEASEASCADGIDNDNDAFIDCCELTCALTSRCNEYLFTNFF